MNSKTQKTNYKNNPKNPSNQPFNVTAKPNKTKLNSWWKKGKGGGKKC